MSTPPNTLRSRFSEQADCVQSPFDASTAKPAAMASAPSMAALTGTVRVAGAGGGGSAGPGGGAEASSRNARSVSASRSTISRASATVQTSQVFDFVTTGSTAGAAPSVENARATVL